MAVETGRLNKRITFQTPLDITDNWGHTDQSWSDITEAYAEMRYLRGRELVEARQIVGKVEIVFTVRYSALTATVNTKDRIQIGSDVYDILAILPIPGGRPENIQIMAKKRADD